MADIRTIMDDVARLANTVSAVLPQAGTVKEVVAVADKVLDIMDTLRNAPSTDDMAHTQTQMQQAREQLSARVKAHAARTSSELRGGRS